MMTTKEETAEQKLLKMIEAGSAGSSPSFVKGKNSSLASGLVAWIKMANTVLLFASIGAVLFFAYSVKTGLDEANQDVNVESGGAMARSSTNPDQILPILQRVSYYLAATQKRDLFQPYDAKPPASVKKEVDTRRLSKAIESYKLVGVAWFETIDTASVMIEDTKSNVTYFLKRGEALGNINVKTIYADGALLGLDNEEIIIRYDK